MNLNPFLAALGGAFRGAAMDTEMQRRLQEAEAERQRIARAEARQAELDARQVQMDALNKQVMNQQMLSNMETRGYVPATQQVGAATAATGPSPLDAAFREIASKRYDSPTTDLFGTNYVRDLMRTPDARDQMKQQNAAALALEEKARDAAEREKLNTANHDLDKAKFGELVRHNKAMEANSALSAAGKSKQRALPASVVEKLGAYDALDAMTQDVKAALDDAVKNRRDVTGRAAGGYVKTPSWWKNQAPTFLGGKPTYTDAEGRDIGVDTRAMMGNLYATLAKERGGTALSANEIRLLESYLPNENEDEAVASLKAGRFLRELRRLKAAKVAAYQQYGYGVDDNLPMGDQPIGSRPSARDLWENE